LIVNQVVLFIDITIKSIPGTNLYWLMMRYKLMPYRHSIITNQIN